MKKTNTANIKTKAIKPTESLAVKYGVKGTVSEPGFTSMPSGLLDPTICSATTCSPTTPKMTKGSKKWSEKNRFRVALSTQKPPHNHVTIGSPMIGIAEKRFVITVAPQKLI